MSHGRLQEVEAKKRLKGPVEEFLKNLGYKVRSAPITKEFMAKPDFFGKRENYAVAVYSILDPRMLGIEISRVKTVSFQLGKDVDYVLLLPPQDEDKLIEVLCANGDRDYKKIMKEGFILWTWDDEKKKAICYFNLPRDKELQAQIENRGDIVAKKRGN